MTLIDGLSRATDHAHSLGIFYDVRRCEAHDDLQAAADELGIELQDVVKTMILRAPHDYFVAALVPGGRVLSWPKLRRYLGTNRISIAPAVVAAEVTGYPKGGISILGNKRKMPIVADSRIQGRKIAVRAGTRQHNLLVDADSLCLGLGVAVSDLTDEQYVAIRS